MYLWKEKKGKGVQLRELVKTESLFSIGLQVATRINRATNKANPEEEVPTPLHLCTVELNILVLRKFSISNFNRDVCLFMK